MKILVDKLPTTPKECSFHRISNATRESYCSISDLPECKLGTEGFKCPHLREFKATTNEPLFPGSNARKCVPVELID